MNISEHLSRTARIFSDRIAIRFEGSSITYHELDALSRSASDVIRAAGIEPGNRVAIMLANVPAFAVWYYAALRIGAIAVSMSTRSAASEVAYFAADCDARLFITDSGTLDAVGNELPECISSTIVTDDMGATESAGTLPASRESLDYDPHPQDPATILYTSGTTGFAKGATLSHMNVRSNVCAFNHLCNMQSEDRILLSVPLFHCFGQNALLNSALNVGATLVLQRKFDLNEAKRLIAEEQITQLYGVPMMFQLLMDSCEPADLSSVNYCFSAAATLPVQTGQRWHEKFGLPIHEGYGLTETSPFASYNHRDRFVAGSIGTPIDGVEMKVVDTDTGEECPPGEPGEIVIRGPNVMLGYWNRDEETRAAIRDGWFHSGDIGRQDEDSFFYIVDRVKDMIAVGGLKVFPAEVERVLLDHPQIAEAAVVGGPDDVFGEQVVAYLVLTTEPDAGLLEDISRHAKSNLANYKVPRTLVPIDELPRNPSGKILKRALRELPASRADVASGTDASGVTGTTPPAAPVAAPVLRPRLEKSFPAGRHDVVTTFLCELVQTVAGLDHLPSPEERFLDVGLDSLMIVEVSNQLQAELGPDQEIRATLVFDYPRITDLADYLLQAMLPEQETSPEVSTQQDSTDRSNDADRSNSTDGEGADLRTEIESMSEDEALAELMRELD